MQIAFVLLLFGLAFVFSRKDKGWGSKLAPALATVAIFMVFEYLQNFVEMNFEKQFGGIVLLKVLLNVVLALVLIPAETLVRKVMRMRAAYEVKKGRKVERLELEGLLRKERAEGILWE